MDESGRVTIPKPVRQALEIEGEEAVIQVEITVREVLDENTDG